MNKIFNPGKVRHLENDDMRVLIYTRQLLEIPIIKYGFTNYSTEKVTRTHNNNFNYCINSVKSNDFNTYLSTLIAPNLYLRPAFTVKALNIELLSIMKSKYDPRISQIKIQFWKDQVEKIFKIAEYLERGNENEAFPTKISEPISNEILSMIKEYQLKKSWFNRMIDGRKQFLNMDQFKTMDHLENYGDAQISSTYYILLNCMGVKNNVDCDHAASHLGKAIMISKVVRNMLRPNSQSVYCIPLDLLVKHKISQQDLINLSERQLRPKTQQLKDLSFELCTRANQHLNSARDLRTKIPREVRPIFAESIVAEVFLSKMEKFDFDLMDPKLNSDFRIPIVLKLMRAKLTSSY